MSQSAQHKAKIASGVKGYHACARSKGCGRKKSVAKKAKTIQSRFKKDARVDKILENRMKAQAKAKLQERLRNRKKKPVGGGAKKPAKKPVRKRRTKKEMAEAKAMGMEDRRAPKKPVGGGGAKKAKEVFYKVGSYNNEGITDHPKVRDLFDEERNEFIDDKVRDNFDYYEDERRGEGRREKLLEQGYRHAVKIFRKAHAKAKKARKYKTRDEFATAVAEAYKSM